MAIAAFWGTSAGYTEYHDTVIVETIDGRVAVIRKETFDYLYFKLDDFNAALKEDCIHYAINEPEKDLMEYPLWFIEACEDGLIYENERGTLFLYNEAGELAVSTNAMVVRNYRGELSYLEAYNFHKYYDILKE